jgi:Domain of unknown function (DUF4926)
MIYKELDTVVLNADISTHGLKKGDVGAVVHVYSKTAIEVEFVTAAGHTQAVLTLSTEQLRPANRNDALSVRHINAA